MTVLVAGVFSTPAVLSWGVTDSGVVRHDGYYTTVAEPLTWLALLGLVVLMWISALVRPPVVKLVLVVVGLALMVSVALFEYPLDDEQWIPREALAGYEPDLPSATTVGQAGGVFAFPAIVALLAWSWIRAVRQRRTRQTAHVPSAGTPMGRDRPHGPPDIPIRALPHTEWNDTSQRPPPTLTSVSAARRTCRSAGSVVEEASLEIARSETAPAATGKTEDPHATKHYRRVLLSSFLGSAIEYYDFLLYGTAASLVFGPLLFQGPG